MSQSIWLGKDQGFDIWNYPDEIESQSWQFINVNRLEPRADIHNRFFSYNVMAGRQRYTRYGLQRIELGFGHHVIQSENGALLKYSDMIDPSQGFVAPSSYVLEKGFYTFNNFQLNLSTMLRWEERAYKHRAGFSLATHILLNSKYEIYHTTSNRSGYFYYEDSDMSLQDFVWRVVPGFVYEGQIVEKERLKILFNTSIHYGFNFPVARKRVLSTGGRGASLSVYPLWNYGITVELKSRSRALINENW